jgi:hypothetical protein
MEMMAAMKTVFFRPKLLDDQLAQAQPNKALAKDTPRMAPIRGVFDLVYVKKPK